ncbi:M56 family metallopeptidase [Nocardia sp. CDC159]|uniref:M56 family metallopeptidase n=1 Tax=Nocardia pulmonis TaxID=2951408 RepID=A0A9X2EC53_9NOCA|nr:MULTISPECIES: M56 family metallopeptidase [Nocardia]MCM6778154.1 M56 family metallopeptidase [Nocardia pulmonis]MCM6791043.1 M56 family metallopeptidase [Nocardia sp. CDC159]
MSVAVGLFVYGVVVAVVAPRALPRLTRHGLVPHLGVVAWLTLMASVLGSWAVAVGLGVADAAHSWLHADRLVADGLHEAEVIASGHEGLGAQVALLVVTAALALLAVVLGVRLARLQLRMRLRAREHADALRLTGRKVHRDAVADLVLLESEERAAYCVAGSPSVVVVTSGAVAALRGPELAAVLAHEHAHLERRHPLLLTVTRGLATTFGRLRLFTVGAREVARLLEMCADDAAVRRHGRAPLLSGLLALSGVAPAGALAASGADVLARAERLVAPRRARRLRRTRMGLLTGIGVAVMGPLLIVGAASGVLICLL